MARESAPCAGIERALNQWAITCAPKFLERPTMRFCSRRSLLLLTMVAPLIGCSASYDNPADAELDLNLHPKSATGWSAGGGLWGGGGGEWGGGGGLWSAGSGIWSGGGNSW